MREEKSFEKFRYLIGIMPKILPIFARIEYSNPNQPLQ